MKIGFMQGRLSPIINGLIQRFPVETWKDEFLDASRIGFQCMEWTLDHDGLYKNPLLNLHGQKEILSLSHRHSISISSVTGDCFMQAPYWKALDKQVRISLLEDFSLILRSCGALKIKYLVVPLVDEGSIKSSSQLKILMDGLNELIPLIEENEVKIVFESDFEPRELKNFISEFPAKFFGINYDIGNSAGLGFNPIEEFSEYSERIYNVHIKDREFMGKTVPLGSGAADFIVVFKLLDALNYKGNLILQTARDSNGDHAGALSKYKNFIENLIVK